MGYTRGVLTTGAGGYGYVQSFDFTNDGDELLIDDENGVTQEEQLFNEKVDAVVTAKFNRSQTLPARGDAITLAACPKDEWNGKYTVVSIGASEQNKDACTLTLNLRRFIDGGIPS